MMSITRRLRRRLKPVRATWWACTEQEEARKVYERICRIDDVTVTGVTAELAECTKVPPDRLPELRANPPDGVRVIGDHAPGSGPWHTAAILVPLSAMGPFRPWYAGGKYRHRLDDMWLGRQVAEYPIDCNLKFSRFYLANTRVLESFDVSANSGVKERAAKSGLSDAKCNHCGRRIKYGQPILRHATRRHLVVCKRCTVKGVSSGRLSKEAAELEPYDD
jgi:hypothetical protein